MTDEVTSKNGYVKADSPQQARKGYRRKWRGKPSEMQDVCYVSTGYTDRPVHTNLRSRVRPYRPNAIVSSDGCKGISPINQANVQLRGSVGLSHRPIPLVSTRALRQ